MVNLELQWNFINRDARLTKVAKRKTLAANEV